MNKILLALFFCTNLSAATIKISSFTTVRIGDIMDNPLAEVCGSVTEAKAYPAFVKVISDPGSRNPGVYNTLMMKRVSFV